MWTKRPFPLKGNLFFHLCGEMLYKVSHIAVGAIITMAYQVRCEACRAVEAAINQELDS